MSPWITAPSPAFTVSSNVMTSVPECSSRVGAVLESTEGATVSEVRVMAFDVAWVEAAMSVDDVSSTAPAVT